MPDAARVCALYPDLMNIYADRGNLLVLERRCRWRGIDFELHRRARLGESLDPDGADLYYIGGGQDRDQQLCALDLAEVKRDALHAAAARGAVIFAVCGGYQLLGHSYELGERDAARGRVSRPEDGPLRRPAVDRQRRDRSRSSTPGLRRVLAGFENHGGRTNLGPNAKPLGRVLKGHGNNGTDGHEGVRSGNVIGTYLHGPLLPEERVVRRLADRDRALGLERPLDDARRHARSRRPRGRAAGRGSMRI